MTETVARPPAGSRDRTRDLPPLLDVWSVATVVLGSLQPLAGFVDANVRRLVSVGPVLWDIALWVVAVLAVFVVVRLLTRRRKPFPIAAGFAVFNLAFWNHYRFIPIEPASTLNHVVGLLIWVTVTGLLVLLAMRLAEIDAVRAFVVIFLALWTILLAISATSGRARVSEGEVPAVMPALDITFRETPNVYWLMLDEHARSDELRRVTGSDNSWFSGDLRDRGFSVSESTESGYLQTHLSITSTLAMDYLWQPGNDVRNENAAAAPIANGANPVVATFERNGYRYVGAPDGSFEWNGCPDPGPTDAAARGCIEPISGPFSMREPHSYLVWSTPVGTFDLPMTHNDLDSVTAGIDGLLTDDSPFFLYAHLLTPHFPYRYDTDCSLRPAAVRVGSLTRDELAATYANEVQCLDREVVATVDHILERDPDAVIVLQSDHGSQIDFTFGRSVEDTTDEMLQERFGALNAIRLPAACRGDSIEGEPLVNTFRLVLACLGDVPPDLLPSRSFFTEFIHVDRASEVTDRLATARDAP